MIRLKQFIFIGLCTIFIGCVPTTEIEPTNNTQEPPTPPATQPPEELDAVPLATPHPTENANIETNEDVESDRIQVPVSATADRSVRLTPGPLSGNVEAVSEMVGGETAVTPSVIESIPDQLFNQLVADFQTQTEAATPSYQIIRAEEVVWNDGSLGCAQPGQFYTQALVAGYWVVFQVGDKTFDYRLAQNGYFVLCESNLRSP